MKVLPLNGIRIDGGTQPRAEIDQATIADYVEAIEGGDTLPPIVVFHDGKHYWLGDGFHRYHAHKTLGRDTIAAEVHEGMKRDAILYSVGANATHGLKRSRKDKRQAVMTLLRDEEWQKWSDSEIARHCKVDHKTVGRYRGEILPHLGNSQDRKVVRGGTTYTQNTSNIGVRPTEATDDEVEELTSFDDESPSTAVLDGEAASLPQAEVLRGLMADIQKLRQRLKSAAADPVGTYVRLQQGDSALKDAWNTLKFALPHAQCPRCKGNGCTTCHSRGWLPKDLFEALPKG